MRTARLATVRGSEPGGWVPVQRLGPCTAQSKLKMFEYIQYIMGNGTMGPP